MEQTVSNLEKYIILLCYQYLKISAMIKNFGGCSKDMRRRRWMGNYMIQFVVVLIQL